MIWFTADTHFGDHRTINISKRPFASSAAMDAALIERWNATVAPEDEVWHLGDVARRPADVAGLLERLHGAKHLIRGNNDPDATLAAEGWASVGDYAEIDVNGRRLVLCHYPFRTWNGQGKGAINLHGHSHGRLAPIPRQFDVGVDVRDFAPVTLADLLASNRLARRSPVETGSGKPFSFASSGVAKQPSPEQHGVSTSLDTNGRD